ncbi:flagellin N-terminal helical domain-containing protein [Rhizobium sp. SAFR-030]|uniref:flagellin N-terminal helical domain-containing protein n=1 Tax=Rhizobium sp. SAFR-030 TaxID=3387277 RepID=UPI003F81D402
MSTSFNPMALRVATDIGRPMLAVLQATTPPQAAADTSPTRSDEAYWSISTTFPASALSLSSVDDAISASGAVVDVASAGLRAASGLVAEIRATLVSAKAGNADRGALDERINGLKQQLQATVAKSSFDGRNLLKTGPAEAPRMIALVAGVDVDASGAADIKIVDHDTALSNLIAEGDAADGLLTRSYAGIDRSGAAFDRYLLDVGSVVSNKAGAREIVLSVTSSPAEIGGMIFAVDSMLIAMKRGRDAMHDAGNRIGQTSGLLQSLGLPAGVALDTGLDEAAARQAATGVQQMLQASGLNIANASMGRGMQTLR